GLHHHLDPRRDADPAQWLPAAQEAPRLRQQRTYRTSAAIFEEMARSSRGFQICPPRLDGGGKRKDNQNDPEKLAGTDQAEQDRVLVQGQDPDDARRRAAGTRLWADARQRAAPRSSVVAARRRRHGGADRR